MRYLGKKRIYQFLKRKYDLDSILKELRTSVNDFIYSRFKCDEWFFSRFDEINVNVVHYMNSTKFYVKIFELDKNKMPVSLKEYSEYDEHGEKIYERQTDNPADVLGGQV